MPYQSPLNYEFIRIPLPIQNRKKDLGSSAMVVYGYLAKIHYTNIDGWIVVINKDASKELKLSEKTIKEAFKILSGYGLTQQKKVGRYKAYKLMPVNANGYPESIPDYDRPKKSMPKSMERKQPITRGVLNQDKNNRSPGGCSIPSTRGVIDTEHQGGAQSLVLPNIRKNKELKEMPPQGIFLKKHGPEIPKGIDGQFRQSQLDSYHLKYGDVFLKICHDSSSVPIHQRAKYVQGAVNNLDNKAKMRNERINIEQNERYKEDLIFIANEVGPLLANIGGQI